MLIQPIILSGGAGTRLWPLSRDQYPKQLLPLVNDRTMLQDTALRMRTLAAQVACEVAAPIVVCNEEYRFMIAQQLHSAGFGAARIVLEPVGRNTAPALTLAALAIDAAQRDDALMLVMPADHVITDVEAFCEAVASALTQAARGDIITFGITPDRAETGYGYLRMSADAQDGVHRLERFVEKPDAATAAQYVAQGDYLWNAGIFLLSAASWLVALRHLAPEMLDACHTAMAGAATDLDFVRVDRAAFEACPADSIDYAVMEPLTADAGPGISAGVVPMQAGWSDVGAWDALWSILVKDDNRNACRGDVLLEDTRACMVHASDRMVACVGVDDLIVIETTDAVLVADKSRTQDVKKIVARLKAEGRSQASAHRKIHRPWGYYDSVDHGDRFQVKRIVVNPGARLSLQMHHHRAEHWIVVRGTARVTRGDEAFLLSENQSTFIPLGVTHRLENPGKLPLEMIEVQSGSYLGEDDIVRFEDTYGR